MPSGLGITSRSASNASMVLQLLGRERVRGHDRERVALEAQTKASEDLCSRRVLDNHCPGRAPRPLGALDHRQRHPILVGAGWVGGLDEPDLRLSGFVRRSRRTTGVISDCPEQRRSCRAHALGVTVAESAKVHFADAREHAHRPARRPGRGRQEHDGGRVRRRHRRDRRRALVPTRDEHLGVDLVLPDFEYLRERRTEHARSSSPTGTRTTSARCPTCCAKWRFPRSGRRGSPSAS